MKIKLFIFFIVGILVLAASLASAQTRTLSNPAYNYQFSEPGYESSFASGGFDWGSAWPIIKNMQEGKCEVTQDFIIMIPPLGCTPTVVRSDLLAEQSVPVFCQLSAIKINPLIDVSRIRSITFKGKYPEGVQGISFHPNRAAVRSYNNVLGNPMMNNIGYVVIILKQNRKEDTIPSEVFGNLTATLYYDSEQPFGVGKSEFYAPVIDDEEWNTDWQANAFWKGRGFLRVTDIQTGGGSGRTYSSTQGVETGDIRENERYYSPSGEYSIGNGRATVQVYNDKERILQTITLDEGQTSNKFYLPGSYCKTGFRLRLNSLVASDKKARLNVDGDEMWVTEGAKILGDRCRVAKITINEENIGSVQISCFGKTSTLIISKKGAVISVDKGENKIVKIGEEIDRGLYLGYLGKSNNEEWIVVLNSSLSAKEIAILSETMNAELAKPKIEFDKLESSLKSRLRKNLWILKKGDEKNIQNINIHFIEIESEIKEKTAEESTKSMYSQLLSDEYFEKSDSEIEKLLEMYSEEKTGLVNFAEKALYEQAELAGKLGKMESQKAYLLELTKRYPESSYNAEAIWKLNQIGNLDYSRSVSIIYANNENHYISLERLKDVNSEDKQVSLSLGTRSGDFTEGKKIGFGSFDKYQSEKESYILIKKIGIRDVQIQYYRFNPEKKDFESVREYRLGEGEIKKFENEEDELAISDINVKSVAYISVIPEKDNQFTEASFTFRVGIEKRAIKLSPSQAKDMIESLNKTIEQWEKVNKQLTNVLKGWKGACFATSGVLALKNLASGFSGESIARQKVMANYREKCRQLVAQGTYKTKTQCYNALSKEIESEVSQMTGAISKTNEKISTVEKDHMANMGVLGLSKVVDGEAALADYKAKYGSEKITISDKDGTQKEISINDLNSFEEIRAFELIASTTGNAQASARVEGEAVLRFALNRKQETQEVAGAESAFSKNYQGAQVMYVNENAKSAGWDGQTANQDIAKFNSTELPIAAGKTPVQFVTYNTKNYALILGGQETSNRLGVMKILEYKDGSYSILESDPRNQEKTKIISTLSSYAFSRTEDCKNSYSNYRARFYETGTDQALPEILPFDTANGWYVKIPSSLGTAFSTGMKGYTQAGDVSFFYICNVGLNGREENLGGDDICQSFDVNTYVNVNTFSGCSLNKNQISDLIQRARRAIREASSQYASGKRGSITLTGVKGSIPLEPPAVGNSEIFECQDFMSAEDCKLMFNVCDPVICPPSRCNLGGKYYVSNVVQTGIIGSIALCLPNYREGIIVPVCLTGIQAGIDSFVSILKSGRDCLQRNVDSGEYIGICDEITSIYLCEFFWRQAAPMTKMILPTLIENLYGGTTRGGGEYTNVMSAWNRMEAGVSYFQNTYAESSFNAYKMRSTEEIGGSFCKAFVGTSFPSSGKMLDNLLAPESPEQFYAKFDEIPFSEATVPATSQYKVYFHIYAGRDIGAYYSVYLRNPPATGYYTNIPRIYVKSDYIPKGQSADQAVDFTAPSGYKELCVVINTQEHCGFGQVTTDFGLNYVQESYLNTQAQQTITTEKECISGTPGVSAAPLVNPNVQAGAEEMIAPEINKQGIIRVCASGNPGVNIKNKNGTDKWKNVGYCGNRSLTCWLDTESVDANTRLYAAVEGTLQELANNSRTYDRVDKFTNEETLERLSKLKEKIGKISDKDSGDLSNSLLKANSYDLANYVIQKIDNITKELDVLAGEEAEGKAYFESQKAEALFLKGSLYRTVSERLWAFEKENANTEDAVKNPPKTQAVAGAEPAKGVMVYSEIRPPETIAWVYYSDENNNEAKTKMFVENNKIYYTAKNGRKTPIADIRNSIIVLNANAQTIDDSAIKKDADRIGGMGYASLNSGEEEPEVEVFGTSGSNRGSSATLSDDEWLSIFVDGGIYYVESRCGLDKTYEQEYRGVTDTAILDIQAKKTENKYNSECVAAYDAVKTVRNNDVQRLCSKAYLLLLKNRNQGSWMKAVMYYGGINTKPNYSKWVAGAVFLNNKGKDCTTILSLSSSPNNLKLEQESSNFQWPV